MAKVRQRTWTIPGQRTKRKAWGFVTVDNGKQVRQFKAEWTREDAENALAAHVLKVEQPKAPAPGLTLAQAAERYLAAKTRKRSVTGDRRILEHFKTEFGKDTLLTDITAGRISEYRAKRLAVTRGEGAPLSPAAVNRPLALLRHLLRLACDEWEALPAVPKIRLEKEPQGRLRWLTPEEAGKLLEKCRTQKNPNVADLAELALYTGMRQGELLGLTWDRVDRARGVVLLERTKSGRRREVPLNGPADAILARRTPETPPADSLVFDTRSWYTFRGHWEASVTAAGLEDFRFHDLRHTFASWAIQRGATLPELKDLLGHSSLAMVMRYAHLSPEHLRSAVARLDTVLTPQKITQAITHEPVVETTKGSR